MALLEWHLANLEYGCASHLGDVSALTWDQDDVYGTDSEHCVIRGGFEQLTDRLARDLRADIILGSLLTKLFG